MLIKKIPLQLQVELQIAFLTPIVFLLLHAYVCTCCTMLQKLSKFEVKPWLCWNLIILPPLRFYVKSNFGIFKRSKKSFLAILEVLNFEFGQFEQFFKSQICQNSKFRVSKIVKMAIFEIQILLKLISRNTALQLNSWISILWWALTSHF